MAPQWNRESLDVLISAYREEPLLYVVKHKNYYNKHLRAEALSRIVNAVCLVRPNTTLKECSAKIHCMRNAFNTEHGKVKSSMKSGSGVNDLYTPSLWYYEKLMFLAQHYAPRKSISVGFGGKRDRNETDVISNSSESSVVVTADHCAQEEGVYTFDLDLDFLSSHSQQGAECLEAAAASSSSSSSSLSSSAAAPTPPPPTSPPPPPPPPQQQQAPPTTTPPPSIQETPSRGRGKKRNSDSYLTAVEVIAQKICGSQQPENEHEDFDSCLKFIGSVAKKMRNKKLVDELMIDLVTRTLEAKKKDLE